MKNRELELPGSYSFRVLREKWATPPTNTPQPPTPRYPVAMPRKPTATKKRKSPPYPFLTEALAPLDPEIRPMFSGYAVYIGDKIVCMLRDSAKATEDNGLWLVLSESTDPADPSLRKEFPSLRRIVLLGDKISHWLLIPADGPDFETESLHACDLIRRHDARIGRIPESRKSKPSKPKNR
ncbi:TfoX/Sxy family protein [Acidicapsa dinghuensis]|uniref:TfoX/Sxy family protein n=1 Tax=Acidicapsa dinghuensis TaxID=2218256 RepID=A0ABW1E9A0_9BACT|nr:TfoX/Sxy family protein [Acidicapsa dinghuensis]